MRNRPLLQIIDDEPIIRESLDALLGGREYDIALAGGGAEALARMKTEVPDLILVDLMMPGMNGIEVCRQIRAEPQLDTTPVIMLTAHGARENLLAALEAGADEFVTKPVSGVELRARVRSLLRLKALNDRQKVLLRQREELVHMIVHDIRQPLTVIRSYTSLQREDLKAAGLPLRFLETIETQVARLNKFTDEMLLMAKCEDGRLSPTFQTFNVADLLRNLTNDYAMVAKTRDIILNFAAETERQTIEADRNLVSRSIENLLSNALKFSPPGSTIQLRLTAGTPEICRLEVCDQGPGIPAEYRERIFDKFSGPQLRHTGVLQVGLGLAFCRLVAQTHGGTISVRDNQPKGTVFTLDLPRVARMPRGDAGL